MYKILFSPKARGQYLKLEKTIQKRISIVLRRLRFNPERYVIKIVDSDVYRLRVGKYRIILDIQKDKLIILIIQIGHRRNIYKWP